MEQQGGFLGGEGAVQPGAVADVAKDSATRKRGETLGQGGVNVVEAELGIIKERQMGRPVGGDLAHQFGADGAAGTGDHDPVARNQGRHGVAVEHSLGSAEHVLNGNGFDFHGTVAAGLELGQAGQAGQAGQGQALGVSGVEQAAHLVAVKTLGEDDPLGPVATPR